MNVFDEGRLRFTFGDSWRVEKFDSHHDYRQRFQKLHGRRGSGEEGTKAVDFVARRTAAPQPGLYFIEVKDYSEDRIQNHSELIGTLTLKVRDTVGGLVAAYRMSNTPAIWKPFVDGLVDRECRLFVVWLVKLAAQSEKSQKTHASTILDLLKREFRRIGARTLVVGDRFGNLDSGFPDVGTTRVSTTEAASSE